MSDDELRHRLATLEAEVARLRQDAASARALASMADRDVAEISDTLRRVAAQVNASSGGA
ncbi:hypothetical protein ACIGW8_34425 [Streptomyces sioyaensis]|uniref:hypothetical protein n=1 Tax=Streptomyces sioyaensis TaxID=67364 RepID=UPI0037D5E756